MVSYSLRFTCTIYTPTAILKNENLLQFDKIETALVTQNKRNLPFSNEE